MRQLGHGYLVESVEELPNLEGTDLFEDLETTSGNPKKKSISPWRDCKVCGIAVASDDSPIYYIPVAHNKPYGRYNLSLEAVRDWQARTLRQHKRWCNQNVKYDAHVLHNDWNFDFEGDHVCIIHSRAKLYDSERMFSGGYGLDKLAERDLGRTIKDDEDALNPYKKHSQDYGDIHPHVLGKYAITDVHTNRDLERFYPKKPIQDLEVKVTKVLLGMEREGVMVQQIEIEKEKVRVLVRLAHIEQIIFERLKVHRQPSSSQDIADVMLNIFNLPVLYWTDLDENGEATSKANPSFSKQALKDYMDLDDAPVWFIQLAIEYRSLKTYYGLFLESYADKNINGILHCWYNQTIATGRMSCSNPNLTQCDGRAKLLIIPKRGCSIFRADYSQIEFRIIANYIGFVEEYLANPDLDFYQGAADRAGCDRKASKIMCLGSGYGMGEEKCVRQLKALKDVRKEVEKRLSANPKFMAIDPLIRKQVLMEEVHQHSTRMYKGFHRNVPTLKKTFYQAQAVCAKKGFVRTMMGRERHLGKEFSRKAFNAACQGSAADLIKMKIVEFSELLPDCVKLLLQVHDELVFEGPHEIIEDPRFARDTIAIMEENPLPMRVPIRAAGGYSRYNWKDACWDKRQEIKNPYGEKGERYSWV